MARAQPDYELIVLDFLNIIAVYNLHTSFRADKKIHQI